MSDPAGGAVMRRLVSGKGCGARGLKETHLERSGGAGAPPAGTKTGCKELADGARYPSSRLEDGSAARSAARRR